MWGLRSSWFCAPSCSFALPTTAISSGKPADRRAHELLRSVLNGEQYGQLMRNSYLEIKSPRDPGCIYRVLRTQGLVRVIEHGRHKANLCVQTRDAVPGADILVIHQLMIGADEETYLQTANTFTLMNSGTRDTRLNWGMWSY
jgi:hypothetical protein